MNQNLWLTILFISSTAMAQARDLKLVTSNHDTISLEANQSLRDILRLNAEGDFQESFNLANQALNKLYTQLNVQGIISEIESSLNVIYQETIVSQHNRSKNSTFSGSFAGTGYSNKTRTNSTRHNTKMILVNPEEVSQFGQKVSDDEEKLKTLIKSYIYSNAQNIFLMKLIAIAGIKSAYDVIKHNSSNQYLPFDQNIIEQFTEKSQSIDFLGRQSVIVCVDYHYIAYSDSESWDIESAIGTAAGGYFESTSNGSSQDNYFAHSESSCESDLTTVSVNAKDTRLRVDLSRLDRILDKWLSLVKVSVVRNEWQTSVRETTFNNPYFR